jgi:hypothetical protein
MANGINLINTEVLDYSHTLNLAGTYQFGRIVNLSLTAFILPEGTKALDKEKFSSIDAEEKKHIQEILDNGWADEITLGGENNKETIQNVKILSYAFPTDVSNDKITSLRVNMTLQYVENFDNTNFLSNTDSDIYSQESLSAFKTSFVEFLQSFSENYSFSLSDANEFSFQQNINFELIQTQSTSEDLVQKAKNLVNNIFFNQPPKLGYLDSRYDNFMQAIKARGRFSESYDSITNSYSFSRSVNTKSSAYKENQKSEKWSSDSNHSIQRDQNGIISITETGTVQGRIGLNKDSESVEDLYSNAYAGFLIVKDESYNRCQDLMEKLIKDSPDWLEGSEAWNLSDDLKTKPLSIGRSLNRTAGTIGYTIVYTNNPNMEEEGIFNYSLSSTKDEQGYVQVTESGSIQPYDENKNSNFNPKVLYDRFTSGDDVLSRVRELHNSIKDPDAVILQNPTNLISSNVSFPAYGISLTYNFVYSDDKSLRNETYIRKLKKSDSFNAPTKMTANVVAPNIKETNYDSNQTSLGKKSINFECVFKRNPNSNLINKAHTDYLKTSSASILNSIKSEVQKSSFVKGKQNVENQLSFFLDSLSYNFNSSYNFSSSAEISFVDRRGVTAETLEY